MAEIAHDWCQSISSEALAESPCAICAELKYTKNMAVHELEDSRFAALYRNYVAHLELQGGEEVLPYQTTVCREAIFWQCGRQMAYVCRRCWNVLKKKDFPAASLANGLWLGNIPPQLKALNFVEKLLIARYRHSVCIVRLGGKHEQRRYSGNTIVFSQPVAKFYHALPPPKQELDECLAIMLTGNVKAEDIDFSRTPLLVRRDVVFAALCWLKANHKDYADLVISETNLQTYKSNEVPVAVLHRGEDGNIVTESPPVYDHEAFNPGTDSGMCTFAVSGLTGHEIDTLTVNEKIMNALRHVKSGGHVAQYRHSDEPESIYHNERLFPGMFPWLFPYGFGGFENGEMRKRFDRANHVKHLMLYHDRRFQTDEYFPYLVYNQDQIRSSTSGGFLLTRRENFRSVAERLLALDMDALKTLTEKTKRFGYAHADTDAERECVDVLRNIDHAANEVPGSNARKKRMRNEIRLLIMKKGAPSFFVTFSPVDFKSPICLHFAGMDVNLAELCPTPQAYNDRMRAIVNNPMAGSRFFHLMVELFVKHILRFGQDRPGLFGKTSAYYGTVEEQGRLTLHLHLLIWIENAVSPQVLRERLLASDANKPGFAADVIAWLEGCHQGGYSTGDEHQIHARINRKRTAAKKREASPDASAGLSSDSGEDNGIDEDILKHWDVNMGAYRDPTTCLPELPDLANEGARQAWYTKMAETADEIVYLSNRHHPSHNMGCKRKPTDDCRARYPRELRQATTVEKDTGCLLLKKTEAWMNFFNMLVSYLLRCNTDITSLLSGTMMKAIVAYITDYITKSSLKTYAVFEAVLAVLDGKGVVMSESADRETAARRLITKIVNAMTARKQVGGPMVCHELAGFPDHYCSIFSRPVFWYQYVRQVGNDTNTVFNKDLNVDNRDLVVLHRKDDSIVAKQKLDDYRYRLDVFKNYSLYEFLIKTWVKRKMSGKRKRTVSDADELDSTNPDRATGNNSGDVYGDERFSVLQPREPPLDGDVMYKFKLGHPLRDSHVVYRIRADVDVVPTWSGGILPRKDRGDFEFYAMTMLTFFGRDGWRTGADLLKTCDSWSDAYAQMNFSDEAKTVMCNMNVLYECQDARDDYASQRRATTAGLSSAPLDVDMMNSLDHEQVEELDQLDTLDQSAGNKGRRGKAFYHALQMEEMFSEMKRWGPIITPSDSDCNHEGHPVPPLSPIYDPIIERLTSDQWKERVDEAKAHVQYSRSLNATLGLAQSTAEQACIGSVGSSCKQSHIDGDVHVGPWDETTFETADKASEAVKLHDISVSKDDEETIKLANLNVEQTRAFRVIVNQLKVSNTLKPLWMYLGGMGGTGKSQVLKAIMGWLTANGEAYRMIVMAPTGSAAELLGGSTYHSMLGFGKGGKALSRTKLAELKERLKLVDIFFLDEVSMLSCADLYRISERLCMIFGDYSTPFGNKNMVLAGDFAQLAPVGGNNVSLYSRTIGSRYSGHTLDAQRKAMGKSIWHQFTTVVILRQNMRQTGMCDKDRAYRKMLENLRYKACDESDLHLLESLQMGTPTCQNHINDARFATVPVITIKNSHRDAINAHGVQRFAQRQGIQLETFYAEDHLRGLASDERKKGNASYMCDPVRNMNTVSLKMQERLWNVAPALSEHLPGRLDLCIGMPVMMKHNEATELCATNGAEGYVYGWEKCKGNTDQDMLTTLFVQLKNPPRPVQVRGLPPNVVPIGTTIESISVMLPTLELPVQRQQVQVLPNFAMTDYCSQGRTRVHNVIDIADCPTSQSVYTCLSRSASADDTLIVSQLPYPHLQGKLSGDLRSEFRALEILDEIQEAQSESGCVINGSTRSDLIKEYLKTKEAGYLPRKCHRALRSTVESSDKVDDCSSLPKTWTVVQPKTTSHKSSHTTVKTAKNITKTDLKPTTCTSVPQPPGRSKRTREDGDDDHGCRKRKRQSFPSIILSTRTGCTWDRTNWSCAYDSIVTVIWSLALDLGVDRIRALSSNWSQTSHHLLTCLHQAMLSAQIDIHGGFIDTFRDDMRDILSIQDPSSFRRHGTAMASAAEVVANLLSPSAAYCEVHEHCEERSCQAIHQTLSFMFMSYMFSFHSSAWTRNPYQAVPTAPVTTTAFMAFKLSDETYACCRTCSRPSTRTTHVFERQKIMPFFFIQVPSPTENDPAVLLPELKTNIILHNDNYCYSLCAIIYLGNGHYVTRYIDTNENVWFHDGQYHNGQCTLENRDSHNLDLMKADSKFACIFKYRLLIEGEHL